MSCACPDGAWYWRITAPGPRPDGIKTNDYAASFEEAKAQFRTNWEANWEASIGLKTPAGQDGSIKLTKSPDREAGAKSLR